MNISILYEDNHLLVIEKPVNIPVQGDASGDIHLVDVLKRDIKQRYKKPGNVYLGLVHRLDRPVGRAMVFAKTSKAASRLSNLMRKQAITRHYLAIIHGHMPERSGKLTDFLHKNKRENKVYAAAPDHPAAQKAILTYEQLTSHPQYNLVRVQLQTGRPHQIRFQLASAGCPIFGDQKYGTHRTKRGQQIALWSHRLQFQHPTKALEVTAASDPPYYFPWQQFQKTIQSVTF